MNLRQMIVRRWGRLGITKKISLAFGGLLFLILFVSIGSYFTLDNARKKAEAAILNSMQIQRIVLRMNASLEQARRLQRDFFLQYPQVGFETARNTYAVEAVLEIADVISLSTDLQHLIEQPDVSESLRASDIDLNLYLSASRRYSDTFLKAVALTTNLAAEPDGLEPRLASNAEALFTALDATGETDWLISYQQIRLREKDYLLSRQRSSMQSALNELTQLQHKVENSPTITANQKTSLLLSTQEYRATIEKIVQLDAEIRSKFNDFNLQTEAIDPISKRLVELADAEVERARQQVERTNQLAILALGLTVLSITGLAILVANLVHHSITRNIILLTQVTGKLQSGNLDVTVPIPGEDELGDLARAFNSMAFRLQESFHSLRTSEQHYRALFEDSPVSLWMEDFSELKAQLDHLRIQGHTDLESYLLEHPEEMQKTAALIRVLDVNHATLEILECKNKEDLFRNIADLFIEQSFDVFRRQVAAMIEGSTTFTSETISHTMKGNTVFLSLIVNIMPGYEETWSRVLISMVDITERKLAEDALRENEQRYRALFEQTNDAVFILGLDGSHIRVNQRAADMLGYTVEELEKLGTEDIVFAEEQGQSFERRQALLHGEMLPFYERTFLTKDGKPVPTELHAALVRDSHGNPMHIQSIVRDISERKHAEEQIHRRAEELTGLYLLSKGIGGAPLMERLVPAALDGILKILQPDLAYFFLRDGEKLELADIAPQNAWPGLEIPEHRIGACMCGLAVTAGKALYSKDIFKDVRCTWDECKKAGLRSFAALPLWADSEIVGLIGLASRNERDFESEAEYMETVASQISMSLQNALLFKRLETHTQKMEMEIAERKRMEEALRESEKRYRTVVSNMPVVTFVLNPQGIFTLSEGKGLEKLGLQPGQVVGLSAFDVYRDYPLVIESIKSALLGEDIRNETEIQGIVFDVAYTSIHDEQGKVEKIIGVAHDITERKQAEAQILALNAELEQRVIQRTAQLEAANKELESFSYSVSHDLRAPLRAIDGFSRIVAEDYNDQLPEQGHKLLNHVRMNAKRMGELIDDLLKFSRLGRQPLVMRTVNVEEIVWTALGMFENEQENRKVQVDIHPLPNCEGDPSLLTQVWVNLLSNAFKYTRKRENARIEIGCQKNEKCENVYYIKDNGVGFDMEYSGKLFGVFQRLHSDNEFEGTGVGLALVHRIISRHGGQIWPESTLGEGTTFYFTLSTCPQN